LTRRGFSSVLAGESLAGCGRKLAQRSSGWLFIASAAERGIAVTDLSEFRRAGAVALSQIPGQVIRARDKVFVTCPDAHLLFEIDPARLAVAGKIPVPGRIVAAAAVPESGEIAVLVDQPPALLRIDAATRRIAKRIALPAPPTAFALTGSMAAVASANSLIRVSLNAGNVAGVTPLGSRCGAVLFRKDGGTVLVGAPEGKQIVTFDAASGSLLARLPLPFAPVRFCTNNDGGQVFVTGDSGDVIAIASPYQNEVDQTLVAGSRPVGLAVAVSGQQELLFVTNAGSGDLTIFDIETRGLAASVHIGGNPGEVLVTPDGEYALVVNRDSGDVAVVRVKTALDKSVRTKPLFTFFATAASPQSAAIIPAV
jgi:YVTN family beta-propeller protein